MKPVYNHKLMVNFYLWFDHYLQLKGEAYKTYTTDFYYYADERLPDKVVFGSPYKQFCYNQAVTGAHVINTVSGDGSEYAKTVSGMKIDYGNGRVIFDSGVSTGISFSGLYSVKDFNVYLTNDREEDLIIEDKFKLNSRYISQSATYIAPYDNVVPAAFLSLDDSTNYPYALGGENKTQTNAKAVVLAQDPYDLEGILSVFRDSKDQGFSDIPFTGMPFDEYGEIKSLHYPNGFNYTGVADDYSDNVYFVDWVNVSKASEQVRSQLPSNLYVGFIEFEISKCRFPRSE